MFEETGNSAFGIDRVFGRMKPVMIELLADGTNFAVVASGSSPGVATTNGGTTIALTGLPKGANYWFPGTPDDITAGTVTSTIAAQDPTAGTMTLTASAATNGARFKWFFFVNRTG